MEYNKGTGMWGKTVKRSQIYSKLSWSVCRTNKLKQTLPKWVHTKSNIQHIWSHDRASRDSFYWIFQLYTQKLATHNVFVKIGFQGIMENHLEMHELEVGQ